MPGSASVESEKQETLVFAFTKYDCGKNWGVLALLLLGRSPWGGGAKPVGFALLGLGYIYNLGFGRERASTRYPEV